MGAQAERGALRGGAGLVTVATPADALATNAVARLYSDDRAPARLARAALIGAGAVLAPVRKAIVAGLMDAPRKRVPA